MAEKKTVHIISHTHWDREWYLPYEKHHVRLIKLMDHLLEILERKEDFRSFHLDGQTIIIDDYLEVRPEKQEMLHRYIRDGRIVIGPWYILQDEFLTSGEANVRNLQTGLRDASRIGVPCKIGYFPDSFGNIGQAPQLLRQAGFTRAVFGRGVKPTGFNNATGDGDFESPYSEIWWASPDGSRVLGVLFANWYNNGMEIPTDPIAARGYWEKRLADTEKYASTSHLLLMNGCDHQPVQADLPDAMRTAGELFPDYRFVHSNFNEYFERLDEELPGDLTLIQGELRSQRTQGWTTLVNTASARVYIKQANQRCQALLEKTAEPLAAIAAVHGSAYPQHLLTYAWKTLMQNHPHDSICGCSVDEVHREMMTRFAKSAHVAEALIEDSAKAIASLVDTRGFAAESFPLLVMNSTGWTRTGKVSVSLDVKRVLMNGGGREAIADELSGMTVNPGLLTDSEGRTMAFEFEDLGLQFDYELPDDAFRQRYMTRRIRLTFVAEEVPALGYRTYAWLGDRKSQQPVENPLRTGERWMENEFLSVTIHENGSFDLHDKLSGRTYTKLNVYEDTGDIGNEYIFVQTKEPAMTTESLSAQISRIKITPVEAVFEIVHEWLLPAKADEDSYRLMGRMVPPRARHGGRSRETVPVRVSTIVSLERNAKSLSIRTSILNTAKDHRLRALFPTDVSATVHYADSVFEVAERSNDPEPEWTNPSNCQHQQAFVSVTGAAGGLIVANRGLNEYEILRDGRNTIAVTLLRAVGELGDWGVFPTPEAQCLGEQTVEYEIIPHAAGDGQWQAYARAYQYQTPWVMQSTNVKEGPLPAVYSTVSWKGASLALSGVKRSEATGDFILRWFNMSRDSTRLSVQPAGAYRKAYRSTILEEAGEPLAPTSDHSVEVAVKPAEIVTLGFSL